MRHQANKFYTTDYIWRQIIGNIPKLYQNVEIYSFSLCYHFDWK